MFKVESKSIAMYLFFTGRIQFFNKNLGLNVIYKINRNLYERIHTDIFLNLRNLKEVVLS